MGSTGLCLLRHDAAKVRRVIGNVLCGNDYASADFPARKRIAVSGMGISDGQGSRHGDKCAEGEPYKAFHSFSQLRPPVAYPDLGWGTLPNLMSPGAHQFVDADRESQASASCLLPTLFAPS
jgi:hypothetical protein